MKLLFTGVLTVYLMTELVVSSRIQRQAVGVPSQQSFSIGGRQAFCNEGDTVIQQGVYKYKCVNGIPKLVSCIGSPRINNVELQVNETRTVGGFWYKCTEENGRAQYSEEPRCLIGSKAIHISETATVGSLVFLCSPNGIQITGCVFTDENGKIIQTKVGESALVGNVRHLCQGFSGPNGGGTQQIGGQQSGSQNGTAQSTQPQQSTGDAGCIDGDQAQRKNNEAWKANSFRYLCKNGDVSIVACIIDENNDLPVGQTVVKFGLLHRCTKEGRRVSYRSEICGVVNCDSSVNRDNNANNPTVNSQQSSQPTNGAPGVGSENATAGCIKDGQSHPAGSRWTAHNFRHTCHDDGSITVDACVTDSGKEIGIGDIWVLGGFKHICSPRPNGAVYSSQLCGAQVQCGPEGLQQRLQPGPAPLSRIA